MALTNQIAETVVQTLIVLSFWCFESEVFQACLCLLDVKKTRTTPLHPYSNRTVESFNRTFLDYLAKFVAADQREWDQLTMGL